MSLGCNSVRIAQGGRSWQPFGEGKNCHKDFQKVRKSQQILISRQNSICYGLKRMLYKARKLQKILICDKIAYVRG